MDIAEVFRTLGDENRIRVINLLLEDELCVCEIEVILGITQSNASRHLTKLKNAGLITSEKKAQWVYYRISKQFQDHATLLYQYIVGEIEKIPRCHQDRERLVRYQSSGYNCELIHTDKSKLKNLWEEKVGARSQQAILEEEM